MFLKAAVERERSDRVNLESQIREKTREIGDLQQKYVVVILFLNIKETYFFNSDYKNHPN